MGNRAVIAINEYSPDAVGIYLHWNGGNDSIKGFLAATREVMGDRIDDGRINDGSYNTARLIQNIGIFFGGNLSLGVDKCRNLDCDNGNNGVYVVDAESLTVIERVFPRVEEQTRHDPNGIKEAILQKLQRAASE